MEIVEKVESEIRKFEGEAGAMVEKAEAKASEVVHEVEDAVERIKARLMRKVERITAVAEEVAEEKQIPRVDRYDKAGVRRTFPSFVAKVMAEAESGADGKQIDRMLSGLTVEQRVAVKMQMVKAGMI